MVRIRKKKAAVSQFGDAIRALTEATKQLARQQECIQGRSQSASQAVQTDLEEHQRNFNVSYRAAAGTSKRYVRSHMRNRDRDAMRYIHKAQGVGEGDVYPPLRFLKPRSSRTSKTKRDQSFHTHQVRHVSLSDGRPLTYSSAQPNTAGLTFCGTPSNSSGPGLCMKTNSITNRTRNSSEIGDGRRESEEFQNHPIPDEEVTEIYEEVITDDGSDMYYDEGGDSPEHQLRECMEGTTLNLSKLANFMSTGDEGMALDNLSSSTPTISQADASDFMATLDACSNLEEMKRCIKQFMVASTFAINLAFSQLHKHNEKKKPDKKANSNWANDFTVRPSNLQCAHHILPEGQFVGMCLNDVILQWNGGNSSMSQYSVLSDACRFLLPKLCQPGAAILNYTYRVSGRSTSNSELRDLPEAVKVALIEFLADLCGYGQKEVPRDYNTEHDMPEISRIFETDPDVNTLEDSCLRIREIRTSESVSNFIATVVIPALQSAFNELRCSRLHSKSVYQEEQGSTLQQIVSRAEAGIENPNVHVRMSEPMNIGQYSNILISSVPELSLPHISEF